MTTLIFGMLFRSCKLACIYSVRVLPITNKTPWGQLCVYIQMIKKMVYVISKQKWQERFGSDRDELVVFYVIKHIIRQSVWYLHSQCHNSVVAPHEISFLGLPMSHTLPYTSYVMATWYSNLYIRVTFTQKQFHSQHL